MNSSVRSSRRRYREYQKRLRARGKEEGGEISPGSLAVGAEPNARKHKPRTRSFFRLLREFWQLISGYHKTILAAMAVLSFTSLLSLAPLYGPRIVFDNVLDDKPLSLHLPEWTGLELPQTKRGLLLFVAAAMVAISAVATLCGLWARWQTTRTTKRVQVDVRKKVFDHAVRLPLHRVYELKSGGVSSMLREDAGGVGELIFSMLYNPWQAIVKLTATIIILSLADWRLFLGSLILLPTVWLTHKTWIGRIRPLFRDIRSTRQHTDSHATEAFGGMRVVRSFSRQSFEAGVFTRNNHLMARQEVFAWWWMRGIEVAWSLLIPVASAVLLFYGGSRVLADAEQVRAGLMRPENALTLGKLVMFLSYLTALLGPLEMLANSATGFQNNLAGLDRVLDLLNESTEMPARPGAISVVPSQVEGRITLTDLSFNYPNSDKAVLQHVNLEVRAGEMIALVGPSGAGKTTLCNLVARFYDPSGGSVSLDGRDLRDITVESYRRLLGIVEQDTFLFDGSIAENISYGRRGATQLEIESAARAANAHGFISQLTQGYNTFIGERGVKLSGGQRQRLTIARAILADPHILILDEATSNLDTESERLIQTSLQTLMRGRTSFVIAHRLSTIIGADRILVLENGRVIESGKHEDLMRASGRYRQMVDLQTQPPPPIPEPQAVMV